MGVMSLDREKCTKCNLCISNCPLGAWETDEDGYPRQKEGSDCFSCFNCMVPCASDAISIVEVYHVEDGFYATDPHPLPAVMPLQPRDAEGNLDEWNAIERAVYERRSVRNFRNRPVPEPIIRRVLEAGRFAPSAGNCQPWKFVVVTNEALRTEMNNVVTNALRMLYMTYTNDDLVKNLVPTYEADPRPGSWDPRVILGGIGSIAAGNGPVFLDAPVVILILGDERAISGPEVNVGICGQNMNLVANSLGIKACWLGFSQVINMVPPLKEKLGVADPWRIVSGMVLGYPKFKQEGAVAREYRPISWFREGSDGAEIEEAPVGQVAGRPHREEVLVS
jgi:nitroreductase/NAD-dependent dihydropyrimidine dehydrogenase PreA subunit